MLQAITWDFDPEIVNFTYLAPRWYGLLFAAAFYLGYMILRKIWLSEGIAEKYLDRFSWYVILATLLGARLGHVLFYGPYFDEKDLDGNVIQEGYFDHWLSILNIREGGLASHGAAIGILIAMWLYRKYGKLDRSYLWIVDRLVIVVAIGAALVRVGNFANSEIIGQPTNSEKGVVFLHRTTARMDGLVEGESFPLKSYEIERTEGDTIINDLLFQKYSLEVSYEGSVEGLRSFTRSMLQGSLNTYNPTYQHTWFDGKQFFKVNTTGETQTATLVLYGLPRHPAQLYEAVCYLLIFLLLFGLYRKLGPEIDSGLLFGVFLTTLFTARFVIEFIKENQVAFEEGMQLNQGQKLSIPFVLIGIGFVIYSQTKGKIKKNKTVESGS